METVELGKTPISPEKPAGEDIRYEPEFEALQAEIEKLSSPTSTGAIDWDKVVHLSREILAEKSKNLIVAGYLCIGLLQTESLAGLGPGTSLMADLVETFWNDLYPPKKRMRGRKNAIEWLFDKLQAFVESLPEDAFLGEKEKTDITASLDRLDAFLAENMDDAPLLHPLKNRVVAIPGPPGSQETRPGSAPELKTAEAEVPAAAEFEPEETPQVKPEPVVTTRTPPVQATGSAQTDKDARDLLRRGLDQFRQAALAMREKEIGNPVAYRLMRIATWIEIENTPPTTDGKTLIPPPAETYVNTLKNLHQQGNFKELINTAEPGVGQYLFWLDLTRYVSEGLMELGHHKAAEAVNAETALFLNRLENIENLAFADGTPFADGETRDWAQLLARPNDTGMTGPGVGAAATGGGEAAAIAESYEQAQKLVKRKKLIDALELMQNDLDQSVSRESVLWRRMNLARLLLDANKARTALPHLMEILAAIDRHKLEEWSPDTALNALTLVYHGFKKQKLKEIKTRADDLIERIAILNPAAAVRLAD
jgi:type VI secretion system protein VasJ